MNNCAQGRPTGSFSGRPRKLGGITKCGDTCLRSLLIHRAKPALMSAHKRSVPVSQWAAALSERVGWQNATMGDD